MELTYQTLQAHRTLTLTLTRTLTLTLALALTRTRPLTLGWRARACCSPRPPRATSQSSTPPARRRPSAPLDLLTWLPDYQSY